MLARRRGAGGRVAARPLDLRRICTWVAGNQGQIRYTSWNFDLYGGGGRRPCAAKAAQEAGPEPPEWSTAPSSRSGDTGAGPGPAPRTMAWGTEEVERMTSAVRRREETAHEMLEATLAVSVPEDWRTAVARAYDATMDIVRCWKGRGGTCITLVEMLVAPAAIGPALDLVRRHPTVSGVDLHDMGGGRLRGTVTSRSCARCRETGSRAFVVGARIGPDGRLVQRLIVEDRAALREVVANYERSHRRTELLGVSSLDSDRPLTPRQEEMVQLAYERGYYNTPKDIRLDELSREFDISVSTMSEIIRKGERKIMERYFTPGAWPAPKAGT